MHEEILPGQMIPKILYDIMMTAKTNEILCVDVVANRQPVSRIWPLDLCYFISKCFLVFKQLF